MTLRVFATSCSTACALLAGCALFASSPPTPPSGPEEACNLACRARAPRCGDGRCARGCNFVLDRLLEKEGDHVLACVASSRAACDDALWADCAARIGVHADGGPPPPPPPSEEE